MYNCPDLIIDSHGRTGSVSLFNLTAAFVMLLLLASGVVNAADRPGYYGLGAAASPEEISGWDIDIRPDGKGLPEGQGSVEDGEFLYEAQYAKCHGSFGEGVGRFPVLAGGEGTLTDSRPSKITDSYGAHTSTLWDSIRRAMPFTAPESLTSDEVYAVTAYVLYLNDLIEDDFVLSRDNFTSIELSNNLNFIPDQRPDVANGRCMQDCTDPASIRIVSSVMPVVQDTVPLVIDNRAAEAAEAAGEKIYGQYCSLCHKSGMGGAPVVGEVSDWQGRAAAGMVTLKKRAIDGYTGRYGFMPPKGGFTHLTDQEIEAVVEYMMDSSQ